MNDNDPHEHLFSCLDTWKENNSLFCNNFQKTFIFEDENNVMLFTMEVLSLNHSPDILIEVEKGTSTNDLAIVIITNQINTNNDKDIKNIIYLIEKKYKELAK